jgi:hypothetical protein
MKPFKFGQLMKHLVRAKQKKPDLPEVFRAIDAPIPEKTITRDMFKEAQERFKNAKAGGGMLVQPGFDGTRQGYANPKGNPEFGKTITGAQFKDTIQPKNLEKLKKLEEIITKSNSQYKKSLTSKAALELAGFKGGYQAIATKGKLREEVRKLIGTLQSTGDKMDNYINNVMLSEDALVKDFKSPMQHLQKKFGVSRGFTDKWAPTSQVVQDNKRLFNNLRNDLSFNKYKNYADGTPRLMSDFSVIVQNKLPSSTSLLRGDSAEKFILESAYRHFKYNKDVGKASKIKFIGDPDLLPINEWKFIKGDKLFSLDPAEDTIRFQGKTYKNNYLNRVDAKDIYKNDFGDVYKIFDDLDKYMNTTTVVGNKDVKLDTVLRRKLFDATGKKNYLLRRAVEIDHFDINKDPFSNLRLLDRRTNIQAGLLKRLPKYKNNPKLLNKVLTDIGYTTPYKNVDTFIKRTTRNIDTPIKVIGDSKKLKVKNLVATLGGGNCGRGLKNQGGRVGLQNGTPNVDVCYDRALKRIQKGGVDFTRAEAINFDKLTKGLRAVGASNIIKFGVLPEVLLEGALVADKMASEGDTFAQALRNSYLAVPFQAMGVAKTYEEGEKDRILAAAPESQKGRILDAFSMRDKLNRKLELMGASEGFKRQIAETDAISDGPFGYVGDSQDLQKRLSDTRADLQDLSRGDLNRAERLTTSSPLDLNIQDQLTRDAFKSAVEKADADKASRILVAPGTGFGVDAQIRRRMKDIPINIDTAKEDLKQTGDMFGIGYTPLGLNQLFPALGLQSREFGVDPVTGEYDQDRGLQDYTNYLRTLQFADTFRDEKAGGGIAKLAGVDSGPPPSSGPNSQGLQGLMKRVRNR